MSGQLALPLGWRAARGERDFFVSEANAEAVRWLDAWTCWPVPVCVLVGPAGSGKSHLAAIFARRAGAEVWDDADRARDEEALFHAWNGAHEARQPLLLTARSAPGDWHVGLPDLRSRLAATPVARIAQPDDALLEAVIAKQLRDRGARADPRLPAFVAARIERSFAAAAATVAGLDRAAMAARAPITVALARSVLAA